MKHVRLDSLPTRSAFRIAPSLPLMVVLGASPDLFASEEVVVFASRRATLSRCDVLQGSLLVLPVPDKDLPKEPVHFGLG